MQGKRIGIVVYGCLLSLAIVCGRKFDTSSVFISCFKASDLLLWAVFSLVAFVIVLAYLRLCSSKKILGLFFEQEPFSYKERLIIFFALLIESIIFLLVYYPGIVTGDSLSSIRQIKEGFLENHHPVFYTLMIKLFLYIGEHLKDENLGIALYCLAQLTICSCTYTYLILWLNGIGVRKWCCFLILAYYFFSPVFSLYSITLWKDPIFTCLMVLVTCKLTDMCRDRIKRDNKNLLQVGILCVLAGLFRNNGLYVVIFISIGMIIAFSESRKSTILIMGSAVMIIYLITSPFYKKVLNANPRFVESVGIPLNQMARVVYLDGNISTDDEAFLYGLLPKEKYKERYNPYIVDPIKWCYPEFNADFLEANHAEFFRTWISLFRKNRRIYVEQYLMSTVGFWRIFGAERENESAKFEVPDNDYGIYMDSFLSKDIENKVKSFIKRTTKHLPTGIYIWAMFFCAFSCILFNRKKYLIPLLTMLGLWGTLMIATPTAFGLRYVWINVVMFPFLIIYPVLIGITKDHKTIQI